MGLFSSSYVTNVNTTVSRVITDEMLPDAIKTGTIKALFAEGEISDYLLEEINGSIGVRAERMYRYAEKSYTHGMPSGEIYSATQGRAQVEAVLLGIKGSPVYLEYSHIGPPNSMHIARTRLKELYGHSETTNEIATLSAQKGTPVYLKDAVVVVPQALATSLEAGVLDHWGSAASAGFTPDRPAQTGGINLLVEPSPVQISPTDSEMYVLVTYVWEVDGSFTVPDFNFVIAAKVTQEATLVIPVTGFDMDGDYFQVKYSHGGDMHYFMYKAGTGTYPTLDEVFQQPLEVMGEFFPFAYFRYEKKAMNADVGSEAYKTSKKLLKYLNMDFDAVTDAIHENPGIADVEQAMMVMAVPANTTNSLEQRYLFDFFDALFYNSPTQATSLTLLQMRELFGGFEFADLTKTGIVIKDNLFKMGLNNNGLVKRQVTGSIGKPGTYGSEFVKEQVTQSFVDTLTELPVSVSFPVATHIYRHQISDVVYEEIRVTDLRMTYYIWNEYTAIGDETENILLIPLDRTITSKYSSTDRELLYSRSLHYVFNSKVITEVKWYQSAVFRSLMIIVAVVATVWSLGSDGGALLAAVISGSTAAIAAAAWALVVKIITGLVISQVLTLFVKEVGAEFALLVAIVAAIYGGAKSIQAGSIQGAPWAKELLQLANGLSQAVQQRMGELFNELALEASEFDKYVKEQTKLLDTAQDLLDTTKLLSPFVIFGETPNDFFKRTSHSGNIGVMGIDAIASYVDVALTLPKLSETLGGNTYA